MIKSIASVPLQAPARRVRKFWGKKWTWYSLLPCGHVMLKFGFRPPKQKRYRCGYCRCDHPAERHGWLRRDAGFEETNG